MTETIDGMITRSDKAGRSDVQEHDADGEVVLECRNLRTYIHTRQGIVRAVDGVDLRLTAGRTLGLVGESGSGKSLSASSILRLIDPPVVIEDGSAILFEGRDLVRIDERAMSEIRGRKIAMIFQEPMTALNPVHTVGRQISEPLRRHGGMSESQAAARSIELLQLVGIKSAETRINDYPHQLSGGMRQRVMIAMALACNPSVILADEPTTALDVTVQAQILRLLSDLRDKLGLAMLLITHDLGVVAEACDDVAVMYAGRIVERGPVNEALSKPSHPYTRALIGSMPVLGSNEKLRPIAGSVPDPRRWPSGCRFAARCAFAMEKCHAHYPPFFATNGSAAACWLHEPPARPGAG